jgi:hypothetical protein
MVVEVAMNVPVALVDGVKEFLGKDGVKFFRDLGEKHDSLSPVLKSETKDGQTIYHPVEFNEGRRVIEYMKSSRMCDDWEEEVFHQIWEQIVEIAIAS